MQRFKFSPLWVLVIVLTGNEVSSTSCPGRPGFTYVGYYDTLTFVQSGSSSSEGHLTCYGECERVTYATATCRNKEIFSGFEWSCDTYLGASGLTVKLSEVSCSQSDSSIQCLVPSSCTLTIRVSKRSMVGVIVGPLISIIIIIAIIAIIVKVVRNKRRGQVLNAGNVVNTAPYAGNTNVGFQHPYPQPQPGMPPQYPPPPQYAPPKQTGGYPTPQVQY